MDKLSDVSFGYIRLSLDASGALNRVCVCCVAYVSKMPAEYFFESKVLRACHVGGENGSERKIYACTGFSAVISLELWGMYRSPGVGRKARVLRAISRY